MFPLWVIPLCALAVADDPVLHTSTGKLHGYVKTADNSLQSEVYMSVPFARPPIGDLRFAKPQPYDDPDADIDATHRPPACPQHEISLSPELYLNFTWYSEDCLFLNIFKPVTNSTDLSIVIYVFGGSYLHGGANLFLWDGDVFASETNTIYVNFNYRLGMFGFLDTGTEAAPGNQGLWDTLEALKWVKKNARAIGGNPDDITLWGQSAGAITVGAFMASPKVQNLFHRAILQSGATSTGALLFKQNSPQIAKSAFVRLGCLSDSDDWETSKEIALDCARRIDVEELLSKIKPVGFELDLISWQPIIGDELIPEDPFGNTDQHLQSAKEVLMTSVSSEGTLFTEVLEKRAGGAIDAVGDFRTVITLALRQVWDISIGKAKTITRGYLNDDNEPTGTKLRQLITTICGDMLFYCPIEYFAKAARNNGIKVYRGQFEPRPSYTPWPAYSRMGHADDVPLSSGKAIGLHLNYKEARSFPPSRIVNEITPEEVQWSLDTVRLFGDFVRNGKPRIPGSQQEWPLYSAEDPQIVYMAPNNFTVVRGLKTDKCGLWEPYILANSKAKDKDPFGVYVGWTSTTMDVSYAVFSTKKPKEDPSTTASPKIADEGQTPSNEDDGSNVIRRGKVLRRTKERNPSSAPALAGPYSALVFLSALWTLVYMRDN